MILRLFLGGLIFTLLPAGAAEKPNFVFIVSEDNSKHYLKLFDEGGAETPHIASLAQNGIKFTRAFSNTPVCSTARTTLATGCYGPRIGTQFHRRSKMAEMPEGVRMFQAYLRDIGYYTTNRSKKDYNAVESEGTWDASSSKATWRNRPDAEQPFFHMQSHAESHEGRLHFSEETYQNDKTSHDPEEVVLQPYFPDTPLFRYTRAHYLDRMQVIDDIVGATVAKLAEDGVLEDTFIFYFGDHGGVMPRGKGYAYESGLHIPLVVRVPENFKHLVDADLGRSNGGFVSFIDFGPTVLNLAGIEVPRGMDGTPFLGDGISLAEVAKRDTVFGYADRFDEKYEQVRTLRIGDWKYMRSFQPYYPDGLQNNYRYLQLAYREWRALFNQGKLNDAQNQFFQPKPAELLFDLSTDPHEVKNLASAPAHQARLVAMREQLTDRLKAMPDLSIYPENVLYDAAMSNPVKYGKEHSEQISELIETANLMLVPYVDAHPALTAALTSDDPYQRYWAATACAYFGEEASELAHTARPLLNDEDPMVRVRAAEFLGRIGKVDPRTTLIDVVNSSDHPIEQLIALNAAAYFHEHTETAFLFQASDFEGVKGEGERRIQYFDNDWLKKPRGVKSKGKK